jgi:hypothetical protein
MEHEFFRQIFEKKKKKVSSSSIEIHQVEAECGRTDRHDEANSRFSQFCARV